jgi:predicted Zn-dependent peptidase
MKTRTPLTATLLAALALAAGCGGAHAEQKPLHADLPIHVPAGPAKNKAKASVREAAPASLAQKDTTIPKPTRKTLPSGLNVAVLESHALPIVQLRVLVRAGNGYGAPAVADVTADLLKDGGAGNMTSAEVLRRIETMGGDLGVSVRTDGTVLSLAVPKDKMKEALAILGEVASAPRFDGGELTKLKERKVDEAESRARQSGGFTAQRLAFSTFYGGPYGRYDVLASEVKKVTAKDVQDFHKKFYVARNMEVVVAGDVDPEVATSEVQKAFAKLRGDAPPDVTFPPPKVVEKRRVIIADRPKSVQSDIYVVGIAPERKSAKYPAMRVANQVLGGGVAGRLFADVRESRSLAYSTGSQIVEAAHGPMLTFATAGTQTPKTVDAVQGLMDNLAKMQSGVTSAENDGARRYLADIFAVRLETLGALADLYVGKDTIGLPDDYYEGYRKELRDMTVESTNAAAKELFDPEHVVIIVAGDASKIAEGLRKFGEVTVTNPEADFAVTRTLPAATAQ